MLDRNSWVKERMDPPWELFNPVWSLLITEESSSMADWLIAIGSDKPDDEVTFGIGIEF